MSEALFPQEMNVAVQPRGESAKSVTRSSKRRDRLKRCAILKSLENSKQLKSFVPLLSSRCLPSEPSQPCDKDIQTVYDIVKRLENTLDTFVRLVVAPRGLDEMSSVLSCLHPSAPEFIPASVDDWQFWESSDVYRANKVFATDYNPKLDIPEGNYDFSHFANDFTAKSDATPFFPEAVVHDRNVMLAFRHVLSGDSAPESKLCSTCPIAGTFQSTPAKDSGLLFKSSIDSEDAASVLDSAGEFKLKCDLRKLSTEAWKTIYDRFQNCSCRNVEEKAQPLPCHQVHSADMTAETTVLQSEETDIETVMAIKILFEHRRAAVEKLPPEAFQHEQAYWLAKFITDAMDLNSIAMMVADRLITSRAALLAELQAEQDRQIAEIVELDRRSSKHKRNGRKL